MSTAKVPPLQVHIEPNEAIELGELNSSLVAIAKQYKKFAIREGYATSNSDAKLLVSSVSPGSIDIGLIPEFIEGLSTAQIITGGAAGGTALAGLARGKEVIAAVTGFAGELGKLLSMFKSPNGSEKSAEASKEATVSDCNDAIAIAGPIANHGGSQTINVHNGDIYQPVVVLNAKDAEDIVSNARGVKAKLKFPEQERRQRVPLQWEALPRGDPKTEGARSPDKGIIEEIDLRPKPVFFSDEYTDLKDTILEEHGENPYTRLYFVDVEVSRVRGEVVSYRVTGYHGQTDMNDED